MRNKNENPLREIDRQIKKIKSDLYCAKFLIRKIPLKRELLRLNQLRFDTRAKQILDKFEAENK